MEYSEKYKKFVLQIKSRFLKNHYFRRSFCRLLRQLTHPIRSMMVRNHDIRRTLQNHIATYSFNHRAYTPKWLTMQLYQSQHKMCLLQFQYVL